MVTMNDIVFEIPQGLSDQSIVVLGDPEGRLGQVNVVITRDSFEAGEDMTGFVDRQLRRLRQHLPAVQVLQRESRYLSAGEAVVLSLTWQPKAGPVFQTQTMLRGGDGKVLVVTVSAPLHRAQEGAQTRESILGTLQWVMRERAA